jgi:hypothetical protein
MAGDEKPFTISHTAITISCAAIGTTNASMGIDIGFKPNMMDTAAANEQAAPSAPQPDSHRGMSFDRYKTA